MSYQPRVAKVLVALLVSMTAGAIVLMALGNNCPSAGAFSLSNYYRLNPIEQAISSSSPHITDRWNRIEVYYSKTKAGNIKQLASINGFSKPEDINCHFVICNGLGGEDGQIQKTEHWNNQWSVIPARNFRGTADTIRICLVGDSNTNRPTDLQVKRLEALLEVLCRKFVIQPKNIFLPADMLY